MNWLTQSAFAIFVLNFSKLSSWKPREREIFSWAHTITIWLQMDKSAIYNKFCVYTSCRVSSNEFLLLFGWIVAVVSVVLVRSTRPPPPNRNLFSSVRNRFCWNPVIFGLFFVSFFVVRHCCCCCYVIRQTGKSDGVGNCPTRNVIGTSTVCQIAHTEQLAMKL